MIAIESSVDVDAEDVPESVMAVLPGVSCLVRVNVEPISAPASVKARAIQGLKQLANRYAGAVEDPQTDRLILASGFRRFKPPTVATDSRISMLNLNYWMDDSPLRTRNGRAALLDYLAIHLPEALPRRYGLVEPPTERWDVGGKDGFLDFIDLHPSDQLVIYTRRPVVDLSFSLSDPAWKARGDGHVFQCSGLTISFEYAALQDPGWFTSIHRAWMALAELLQPVATNVERVDGWILSRGGRLWADFGTEYGTPTRMWFGIPRKLGLAFALADHYVDAWPALKSLGTSARGFHCATVPDWRSPGDVSDSIGDPPDEIRERPGRGTVFTSTGSTYNSSPDTYPQNLLFGPKK